MKIVFVLCDALRYDYYRSHMPELNLFADSVEDHEFCLSCAPYTAISLRYLLCNSKEWSTENNLITDLKKKGYQTTLIQSTPIFEQYEYDKVFENNIDVFKEEYGKTAAKLRKNYKDNLMWKAFRKVVLGIGYRRAGKTIEYSKKHMKNVPENSFTWIHLMDTHIPWMPVNLEDYTSKTEVEFIHQKLRENKWKDCLNQEERALVKRLYGDECRYLDAELNKLIKEIDYDMLIITADHGDLLGEYGNYSHPDIPCPELLHVPLIIDEGIRKKVTKEYSHLSLRNRILEKVSDEAP